METIGGKNGQIVDCAAAGCGPELRLSHLQTLWFLSFAGLNPVTEPICQASAEGYLPAQPHSRLVIEDCRAEQQLDSDRASLSAWLPFGCRLVAVWLRAINWN